MQYSLLVVLIINRSSENYNFTIERLINFAKSYFRNKTRGLKYPENLHKKNFDPQCNDLLKNVYLKTLQ